jgi:histidinol-phosphatase
MPALDDDFALAHRLADAARAVSLSYFRRELQQWTKHDGSLATQADLAVEDELRRRLAAERPDDAVLGEERGRTGSGARCWIVDAIDGTIDFAAGTADWGTLIALEIDGQVVIGVCDQPAHRRRYWATRAGGAFWADDGSSAPRPMRTSTHATLSLARSYLPPPQWVPDEATRSFATALARATKPEPHINHPALQVAFGGYEIAVFFIGGPWDIAAPALIVEEAGGRFTDLAGHSRLTSGHAVFSNGLLHDDVLALASALSLE